MLARFPVPIWRNFLKPSGPGSRVPLLRSLDQRRWLVREMKICALLASRATRNLFPPMRKFPTQAVK